MLGYYKEKITDNKEKLCKNLANRIIGKEAESINLNDFLKKFNREENMKLLKSQSIREFAIEQYERKNRVKKVKII